MYINYLNEIGVPNNDKKSNGGRIPDTAKYGNWLYKNDPIAFNSSFYNDFYR
jgi:hypothetical protein